MIEWIKSKVKLKTNYTDDKEYEKCVDDLIYNEIVLSMKNFIQHSDISCFQHSIAVSYNSYLICKLLGFDYRSAARGGLLHDLFLYDWHITKPEEGLHGFTHPAAALKNADKYFVLNELEKDIIQKHMWPLTIKLPKYKESFVIVFVDKYCAILEILKLGKKYS